MLSIYAGELRRRLAQLDSFHNGKQGKSAGNWNGDQVLPLTAKKLGLEPEREELNFDLVMFSPGKRWGNIVAVEHENDIHTFKREIEKLMSVLAPLKVGITYNWYPPDAEDQSVTEVILEYFETRNPLIQEAQETEYLFLLGNEEPRRLLTWKFLSFNVAKGPMDCQFLDAGAQFNFRAD